MSQPMTDAERDKRVAEIREHCAGLAVTQDDYWVKFLLAERDRLQQERQKDLGELEGMISVLRQHLDSANAGYMKISAQLGEISGVVGIPPLLPGEPIPSVLSRVRRICNILTETQNAKEQQRIAAEAELAKERERVAYLTGSIESRGGI